MRLRWIVGALATVMVIAVAAPASAQSPLRRGCRRLGAQRRSQPVALEQLCPAGPGPAFGRTSRLGSAPAPRPGPAARREAPSAPKVRQFTDEQRQLFRRLRQRQQRRRGQRRSRSIPSAVGVFVTTEYEKFNQDTTRFETGYDRDTVGMSFGADYLFRNGPHPRRGLHVRARLR